MMIHNPHASRFLIPTGNAPRILITRLSHIGDCVLTLPVAAALKQRFPDCRISWAVEKPGGQLIELSPDVDQVIDVPRAWIKSPSNWRALRRTFREQRFDLVIDPQCITKSAALGRLSGAKTRIGIRGRWARELAPVLNNHQVRVHASHLVDRSLEMLWPLGIESTPCNDSVRFPMQACPVSRESVDRWLEQHHLRERPFALINPGASWPSKRWVTERFGAVADQLNRTHGLPSVVVWAGDEEHAMAQQIATIANQSAPNAVIVAARTTLPELMELSRSAQFFFGCDTGPLHIAAAVETPCVGMYGPTRSVDSGAYGSKHVALQAWYQSGTSRQRRNAANDAMRDISIEDACAGCDRMLRQLKSEKLIDAA